MTVYAGFSDKDQLYMGRALALATKGIYSTKPNPAVGCVIVKDDHVIGEGWHQKAGEPHAERMALAEVAQADLLLGATAYVTLEPCSHHGKTPPCADALIAAGVGRVVVAMQDPNPLVAGNGIKRMQESGIDVQVGLMQARAEQINKGFVHKMRTNMPYVRLKMASSVDGRTAMHNGESQWITGAESRTEVHRMRAQAGALITGIGTVLADDPSLTVRLSEQQLSEMNLSEQTCHPLRVVLDPNLSTPETAKMLSAPGRTIIMTSKESAQNNTAVVDVLYSKGAEVVAVSAVDEKLDIESILSYLAQVEHINDVMVESGAIVAGAFMQSGYVNELHSFIAPTLMGHAAKPMFVLNGLESMQDKLMFTMKSVDRFGDDLRILLTPNL